MTSGLQIIDDILSRFGVENESSKEKISNIKLWDLPKDIIRFICVHWEYQEIIQGVSLTCKALNAIVQEFLQSNYYIYRLHITDIRSDNTQTYRVSQIKYFSQYKKLLSPRNSLTNRLPITYVLLIYNFHYADMLDTTEQNNFKKWLFKYWNNGSIIEVVTVTVNIFNRFMTTMHNSDDEKSQILSLNNTVQYLRLTNRGAPQPMNDYNRLSNALTIVNKYNISNTNKHSIPNIYGCSIGFHVSDNQKQAYLQKHFAPYCKYMNNLRLLILHGCHKRGDYSKEDNKINLLDYVMNAVNEKIIYLDLSFILSLKRFRGNNNDDSKQQENDLYLMKFPESVQCINFGYDFETFDEKVVKVVNIDKLTKLKLLYIELNPKRIQIEFIAQFIVNCESLDCVAINLGGLVWEHLSIEQTNKLDNIRKYWRLNNKRTTKLDVVVVTTQMGVHSSFKNIIDDIYGDNNMVEITYLDRKAGIGWLFEYVNDFIGNTDFIFKKLWRLYHFARSNFSSLNVVFQ
eukprot:90737_1